MIVPHPDALLLFEQHEQVRKKLAPIELQVDSVFHTSTQMQHPDFFAARLQRDHFSHDRLWSLIQAHFGPQAGIRAHEKNAYAHYFFDFQGHTISLEFENQIHPQWYYLQPEDNPVLTWHAHIDDPSLAHILPVFFSQMHEMLYGEDLLDFGFSNAANHQRQAWKSLRQQQKLEQATPLISKVSPRRSL